MFHSLSFCLSYDGIVSDIHEDLSGFVLHEQICCYIRDNDDVVISISPDEQRTMSEAVGMDGYTCSSYYVKMMNSKEWDSVFEIAAAAELFQIGIRVYVSVPKKRYYKLLGSYGCFGFDENSREVFLLYSGYNHYDSLVDWSIEDDPLDTCSADYSGII